MLMERMSFQLFLDDYERFGCPDEVRFHQQGMVKENVLERDFVPPPLLAAARLPTAGFWRECIRLEQSVDRG